MGERRVKDAEGSDMYIPLSHVDRKDNFVSVHRVSRDVVLLPRAIFSDWYSFMKIRYEIQCNEFRSCVIKIWRQNISFFNLNFSLCLQREIISFLWFRRFFPLYDAIFSFSFWHKLHLFDSGLYDGWLSSFDHLMVYSPPKRLILYTSLDNAESFSYCSLLNAFLWFPYLVFHSVDVIPLYSFLP